MDSRLPSGGGLPPPPQPYPSKRQLQIQGPRPTPLKVSKDSHKIRKPPPHPAASAADDNSRRQPMIIYAVSPKVIHAEVADFMAIVQRHTGLSSDDFPNTGDVSPAARLAATERASPRERPAEVRPVDPSCWSPPGILSPYPAILPSVAAAFFSPGVQDLSPFLRNMSSSSMRSSPSALFSGNLVSPTLSPDFFKHIWDF